MSNRPWMAGGASHIQGEWSRVQGALPLGQTPGAWLLSWLSLGLPVGPADWPAPPSFLLIPCLSLWKQSLFLPSSLRAALALFLCSLRLHHPPAHHRLASGSARAQKHPTHTSTLSLSVHFQSYLCLHEIAIKRCGLELGEGDCSRASEGPGGVNWRVAWWE